MTDQSDQEFLSAFIETARHFTALAPRTLRDTKSFDWIERRAAEIMAAPPLDLQHRVMEHIGELREEQGGLFGGHNSDLLEELGDHPQARRVFYAVIAACHEIGSDLEARHKSLHAPRVEPPDDGDF